MRRVEVSIEYEDGRTETVILKPVAAVAAERHFKGSPPPLEGTLWGVHYQTRNELPFGDWLETIVGVEEALTDPSSATPSAPSPT